MPHFFYEYEVLKQIREFEVLDRRLEHCGWYRGHETGLKAPGWRFRMGETLIRFGCWLQGKGETEGLALSRKP